MFQAILRNFHFLTPDAFPTPSPTKWDDPRSGLAWYIFGPKTFLSCHFTFHHFISLFISSSHFIHLKMIPCTSKLKCCATKCWPTFLFLFLFYSFIFLCFFFCPVRAHLHTATVTSLRHRSLRHRCVIAPKSNLLSWCCTVTPSDCDVMAMSLGNRFVSDWERHRSR